MTDEWNNKIYFIFFKAMKYCFVTLWDILGKSKYCIMYHSINYIVTLLTYEESSNETCCQKELLPHLQITFYWASKQGEIWFLARHIQIIEIVYLKEEIKSVSSLKKKTVCNNYNLNHRMTYILLFYYNIISHKKV